MKATGYLRKMTAERDEGSGIALYSLELDGSVIPMNELVGHTITLTFEHEIRCIHCGRKIRKTYGQGYCYPCFSTLPETDRCILHPELCQAHLGISRDMEWSRQHCLQDHFVYLALTSEVKVGVTRPTQIPTRWIDQGAAAALCIARTPNRHLAGTIEVFLKKHLSDKTPWRKMLTSDPASLIPLLEERKRVLPLIQEPYDKYLIPDDDPLVLHYPVDFYPEKVQTMTLDRQSGITGLLAGIKGQYLIFSGGEVFNIRKHSGYRITLSA